MQIHNFATSQFAYLYNALKIYILFVKKKQLKEGIQDWKREWT